MCNIGYPGFKSLRYRLPVIDIILMEVITPCVGFSGGSVVKNPPANPGYTQFQFLSREDPLEKGIATHSSILA